MGLNTASDTSMLFVFIGTTLVAALTPGPPFVRRVVDAITGGFFIAVGFLLGTKNADA
jgi:threonine/homoserine/homoserine lactone efflux protein